MTPREDRRFRIAALVAVPVSGLVGLVSSANDWSIGLIYLTLGVIFASAVVFTHYEPRKRSRRRR